MVWSVYLLSSVSEKIQHTLSNFYRCALKSILKFCISAWLGNCSALGRLKIRMNSAQSITVLSLFSIQSIFMKVVIGACHPGHFLFFLLPSGRRYRRLKAQLSRPEYSFSSTAVKLVWTNHVLHTSFPEVLPRTITLISFVFLIALGFCLHYNLAHSAVLHLCLLYLTLL